MKQYKHTPTETIAKQFTPNYYKINGDTFFHKQFIENTQDWTLIEEKKIGWFVSDNFPKWLGYTDGNKSYGINGSGNWFCLPLEDNSINLDDTPSTPENTLRILSEYATKMGYKEGVIIECRISEIDEVINDNPFSFGSNNTLWIGDSCIMKDGIWATIIEPSNFSKEQRDEILLMIDNKLNK